MRWLTRTLIGLAIVVAGLVAVLLIASYAFNIATDGEGKRVQALWQGRFVTAGGVLTAYREWGSRGTPIVLVGGFLEPSFVWADVGPRLARAGHRVYALDLDGFGYTERRGPFTLEEWEDQTAAFMRMLRLSDPVVVGHSLGAAVAVGLAQRGLASRIVLVDGDARPDNELPDAVSDLLVRSPFLTSALRLATRWDWPAEQILDRAYAPAHPSIDHQVVEDWTRQLQADGADRALSAMLAHGTQGFTPAELRRLHVPATVVWGADDAVDSLAAGRQTASDLHARLVVVAGAGHLTPLSNPAAVARAIDAGRRLDVKPGRAG
jgi:pimeloyl-ACP methyl ester carboxylesterase